MKLYKTKDFYFACVLLSNNFKLLMTERDGDKNTTLFCFDTENKEELKNKLLDDYVNQVCVENVKRFTWAIKILKNELYGGKK